MEWARRRRPCIAGSPPGPQEILTHPVARELVGDAPAAVALLVPGDALGTRSGQPPERVVERGGHELRPWRRALNHVTWATSRDPRRHDELLALDQPSRIGRS